LVCLYHFLNIAGLHFKWGVERLDNERVDICNCILDPMNTDLNTKERTRRIRFLFALLAPLLFALLSGRSFASGSCSSGGGQAFTLTLPSTVSVPRDAPVGSLLTAWVSSPASTNLWTCTVSGGYIGYVAVLGPQFTTSAGQTYSSGGVSYTVYQTNVTGVGIVVAARGYTSNSGWGAWQSASTGGTGIGWGIVSVSWTLGEQVQVALVKTGTVSAQGVVSGGIVATAYPAGGYGTPYTDSFAITPVTIVPMTCTTPDVNVPMGTFKTTDLPSIGSLSPGSAAPVNIELRDCPGGTAVPGTQAGQIHTIQYRIDPTAGTLATNVAALVGSPSAGGVGIRLFTSSGSVFPLSTLQTLSGYNSASGGRYPISLTARYYRTGTVTPGPANSTMTLSVLYQ
jgi:major type 1 subunit fimbrin (pilin)